MLSEKVMEIRGLYIFGQSQVLITRGISQKWRKSVQYLWYIFFDLPRKIKKKITKEREIFQNIL